MPAPTHLPQTTPDLTDAEYAELDELLERTPEPLTPCDAVMLDGYLCGVLVQPELLPSERWLPPIFDFEGRPLPEDVDAQWKERTIALISRRHAALNRQMAEDGWFDPLVLEFEDEDDAPVPAADDPLAALSPVSQSLMPWVAGFQYATSCFPALTELDDDAVMTALARLFRHLPPDSDEEREVIATLDREHPLADLEEGIQDLVVTVADLWDLTQDDRYRVETVRHEQPKVGRNEPCPCGSGKKYKQCHGAG